MKSKKLLILPFFYLIMFALGSCSGVKVPKHASSTANVEHEIQKFESELNTASAYQMDGQSQKNYDNAQISLKDAREAMEKGYADKEILHRISKGRAYLERVNKIEPQPYASKEEVVEQSVTEAQAAQRRAFNEKLEKALQDFSKDEAEVSREGNTVTLRLKGIGFQSSKADLNDANLPLLGKVEKVIKEFDPSAVVVEGHADSTGAKATNEKLSENRAQTVRDYFISSGILQDKIQTVGRGDESPLATNETEEGRAQNRRVDIVIEVDENKKL